MFINPCYRYKEHWVDKSMFDLFLVIKDVTGSMHNVRPTRELIRGFLDDMIVLNWISFYFRWSLT